MKIISQEIICNKEHLASAYLPKKDKVLDQLVVENSLGERFEFITEHNWLTTQRKSLLNIAIEKVKYPLTEEERMVLLNHILVVNASKARVGLPIKEYEKLFSLLGIFFRLGVLSLDETKRKSIIQAYCFIYQLRIANTRIDEADKASIRQYFVDGYSVEKIRKELPYLSYMQIYSYVMKKLSTSKTKRWTEKEINIVKEHIQQNTYAEISERYLPHRSADTIRTLASKYGWNKNKGKKRGKNAL